PFHFAIPAMKWKAIVGLPKSDDDFQVSNAENGAFGFIGQTFDLPTVGKDDLLDDGQTQAGAFFIGGEIRLENFLAALGWHARTVVADFERRLGGVDVPCQNLNLSPHVHRLDGVDQKVEQDLAK